MAHEKQLLEMEDGKKIATIFADGQGKTGVLFLHMMPAVKESWLSIMELFAQNGISSLAMDFPGHGESDGGPQGYKTFTNEEHKQKYDAALRAYKTLQEKGAEQIIVIGASIGANVALQFLAELESLRFAIALSPGLDYKGISVKPFIAALRQGQEALFIASEEDTYSFLSAKELHESQRARTEFWRLMEKGHGTEMLETDAELAGKILAWIKKRL